MDSDSAITNEKVPIQTVFQAGSLQSSEEPPMDEWSSLDLKFEESNPKKLLYDEGLYDPGSGEICTKYIALSASSVFRHVYYKYPAIENPDILKALLKPEEPIIHPDDGQELYLVLCKEANQCVVRSFYRGLLQSKIDLSFYGVNPNGVRTMAAALKYNKFVKLINFTDNFLNNDACYHLGDMLASNTHLVELNLSGCRIGPVGLKRLLTTMITNRSLKALNLSKNELGDTGIEYLAEAVMKGLDVSKINLSHNNITGNGVTALVEPFQTYNKFTHWILSWNSLFSPGTYSFLVSISESTKSVKKMDLSWNSLSGSRVGQGIKYLMTVRDLKHLNLSNNQLEGVAIKNICIGLPKATNLVTLNLSFNPMTSNDGVVVLQKLKLDTVNVKRVYMDNVVVNATFLEVLQELQAIKPNIVITYGNVIGTFKPVGPDYRELLLNRLDFLCKKPKKNPVDVALIMLQQKKNQVVAMTSKEFYYIVSRRAGAPIDIDLVDEITNTFPGPRNDKGEKTMLVDTVVEYMARKWPDRHLPPTPPEPEPEPKTGKKKKKGKK